MDTNQYQDCYVAFIDILGFKNLISNETTSCDKILDIYSCFKDIIPRLTILDDSNKRIPIKEVDFIKTKIMSDSICIYINTNIEKALLCLVAVCINIQNILLKQEEPILVRGAISRGDIYAEGDITFGPALTQAYLMEEKNARYPRIIITKQLIDQGIEGLPANVVKDLYDGLLFRDDDSFYSVNFLAIINDESLHKLRESVSKMLDSTTDSSIREKYLYLDKIIGRNTVSKGEHINRGNQNA